MSMAYVDGSMLTAMAFDEPGAADYAPRPDEFSRLISSNLLGPEFAAVLDAGYLRGADPWHVATALHASPRPGDLVFATLDARQSAVAEALGFPLAWEAVAGCGSSPDCGRRIP